MQGLGIQGFRAQEFRDLGFGIYGLGSGLLQVGFSVSVVIAGFRPGTHRPSLATARQIKHNILRALYYTILYYTILYCTVLYCTVLCYMTAYHAMPYSTILLYCTIRTIT